MNEFVKNHINAPIAEQYIDRLGIRYMMAGIAEPLYRGDSEAMPAIVDESGEAYINLFDDNDSLGIYHKLNAKTYQTSTADDYGNANRVTEEADMSMVVYGKRSDVDVERLERDIVHVLSTAGEHIGAKVVNCSVVSASFDRKQIFSTEFSGLSFFLPPSVFLFRINYKIKTTRRTCK